MQCVRSPCSRLLLSLQRSSPIQNPTKSTWLSSGLVILDSQLHGTSESRQDRHPHWSQRWRWWPSRKPQVEDSGVTELGAAFVGPAQDEVLILAQELYLGTFKEYNDGNNIAFRQTERLDYCQPVPPLDSTTTQQVMEIIEDIDALTAMLNVADP